MKHEYNIEVGQNEITVSTNQFEVVVESSNNDFDDEDWSLNFKCHNSNCGC